ncbi:hypothetical protein AB0N89_25285 [Amycolatopsis sp. NPDC089917]
MIMLIGSSNNGATLTTAALLVLGPLSLLLRHKLRESVAHAHLEWHPPRS